MQTNLTVKQLSDPLIAESQKILHDCVHYGFCIPVCPTYVLLGDEKDSPRGRIDLIREMLESDDAPKPETVQHIDRCLSCFACMGTCAARVDYMHLVDKARVYIARNFRRPLFEQAVRKSLAWILVRPKAFRLLTALGRRLGFIARYLPGRLGTMTGFIPDLSSMEKGPDSGSYPAEGTARMRVGVHTGCVQQAMGGRINTATVQILRRHGCDAIVKNEAGCCGALSLHMGEEEVARSQAEKLLDAWGEELDQENLDALVINTSGCGTVLKDYARLFPDNSPYRTRAGRLASCAKDVTEILASLNISPPGDPLAYRVAYHDACSLQHGQKITAPPRELLKAAGFDVRDIPEKHFCCGSAGTYNMLQPEIASRLGQRKTENIESVSPDIVATGNLGCMVQIEQYTSLPVVHTVELLNWATGGEKPAILGSLGPPEAAPVDTAGDNLLW